MITDYAPGIIRVKSFTQFEIQLRLIVHPVLKIHSWTHDSLFFGGLLIVQLVEIIEMKIVKPRTKVKEPRSTFKTLAEIEEKIFLIYIAKLPILQYIISINGVREFRIICLVNPESGAHL